MRGLDVRCGEALPQDLQSCDTEKERRGIQNRLLARDSKIVWPISLDRDLLSRADIAADIGRTGVGSAACDTALAHSPRTKRGDFQNLEIRNENLENSLARTAFGRVSEHVI